MPSDSCGGSFQSKPVPANYFSPLAYTLLLSLFAQTALQYVSDSTSEADTCPTEGRKLQSLSTALKKLNPHAYMLHPRLIIPTGPVKPPPSGSGLPDRFDRKSVEFKSKFKIACVIGLDRFTGQFDRFEFKIACVTGLERFTGRFDRFTKWVLMGSLIFFLFFFGLTLNA